MNDEQNILDRFAMNILPTILDAFISGKLKPKNASTYDEEVIAETVYFLAEAMVKARTKFITKKEEA